MRKGVVAAAAVAILMVMSGGLGHAEVTTPRIRAHAKHNGTVRVRCFGFRGMGSRDLSTVDFERAADGDAFDPLVSIARPRRSQSYQDIPGAGVYWYRCRVVSDTGTSGWSDPAVITALAPPTPRPTRTAKPKPTATPQPTAAPSPGRDPSGGDPPLPSGMHECRAGTIGDVLDLINGERHTAGRANLAADAKLMWAARAHTIMMATEQVLTHDGWLDTIAQSGYHGSYLAENAAVGYPTAASVVDGWMGSTGHRNNILNAALRDTGIGCVVDRNGTVWWTEDFGG